MMKNRLLIASFCFMGMMSWVSAQQARFYVNQDTLSLDDELEVNVLVSGLRQPAAPQFPTIPGFEKKELRSRRESTDQGVETVFSQTYRPAGEPGTYRLEAFEVRVGGDAYLFPSQNLTVLESELIRDSYLEESVDAFLDFRLSKTECFVGEQVVAEAFFFVSKEDDAKIRLDQEEVRAFGQRINNPDFWEERMEYTGRLAADQRIGGTTYTVYQLYKGFLFALKPGEFPFSEIYTEAEKRMVSKWATDYKQDISKRIRFKPVVYRAAPRSLKVLPLPEPQLARSVGQFRMEATLVPEQVQAGQRAELRVRISGDGNVPLLPAPELVAREGFRYSEPVSSYTTVKDDAMMHGSKEFVYGMIPAYADTYELGPVVFAYFDPRQAAYDSLVVHSLALAVTGEDQPQVLQENRQDGFYRLAFAHPGRSHPFQLPLREYLALLFGIAAMVFMIRGIWQEKQLHRKDPFGLEKERKSRESMKS